MPSVARPDPWPYWPAPSRCDDERWGAYW